MSLAHSHLPLAPHPRYTRQPARKLSALFRLELLVLDDVQAHAVDHLWRHTRTGSVQKEIERKRRQEIVAGRR